MILSSCRHGETEQLIQLLQQRFPVLHHGGPCPYTHTQQGGRGGNLFITESGFETCFGWDVQRQIIYYRIWFQDVLWLGPQARKVLDVCWLGPVPKVLDVCWLGPVPKVLDVCWLGPVGPGVKGIR